MSVEKRIIIIIKLEFVSTTIYERISFKIITSNSKLNLTEIDDTFHCWTKAFFPNRRRVKASKLQQSISSYII